jgi:maltose alpha-D-glucosyltransferase/alpha-amylase
MTRDAIGRAFERAAGLTMPDMMPAPLLMLSDSPIPPVLQEFIGDYLPLAHLLAERTAQMHGALDREPEDPAFRPEPMSILYQRSLYQAARTQLITSLTLLERSLSTAHPARQELVASLLAQRAEIDSRLRSILGIRIEATRIRCHGDYHLGQLLFTGNDFVIIDFEGEPSRSIGERRIKQSPLRDVAGMIRSFHYAAFSALHHATVREEDRPALSPWADAWHAWVSAAFLCEYLQRVRGASFLPDNPEHVARLLDFYLIEKCAYEVAYELGARPTWVDIPLHALRRLL